jgi:hypothetical protein
VGRAVISKFGVVDKLTARRTRQKRARPDHSPGCSPSQWVLLSQNYAFSAAYHLGPIPTRHVLEAVLWWPGFARVMGGLVVGAGGGAVPPLRGA